MGLAPVNGEPGRLPLVRQTGGPKVRVALLPGSMVAAKRYPAEGYLHVARGLARAGYGVTVFVGPREVELGKALSDRGGLELFPPSASLDEVAAALAGFSLAIGNDSGLTHLASAVGCPTLALFGPTDPERTAPARGTVLMARGFATRGWKGLPPEAVLATAETLLAGGLQDGRKIGTIPPGGGPLAQLAEQGTLNP
ncbi:MAG: glycosyltransferase family 9 protein [Thermoanaerobaculum sp.]